MVLQRTMPPSSPSSSRYMSPQESQSYGVFEVSSSWVAKHGEECLLVDIRNLDDFLGEHGHIPGAELVPVSSLEQQSQEWNMETPVVLISDDTSVAAEAADMLTAMDFSQVLVMKGGMQVWHQRNLPISHSW